MSRTQRAALVVGAVAVLIVAFVLIRSGGSDNGSAKTATSTAKATTTPAAGAPASTSSTPAPAQTPEQQVRVVGAKASGGIQTIKVNKGDTVRFAVTSDVADEIHVHGYDLKRDVPKNGTVHFRFKATIDGIFVVELESRAQQIAKLVVEP
jgi:FtsP/CotA-like multicopper oxidase with cupredoxin domain